MALKDVVDELEREIERERKRLIDEGSREAEKIKSLAKEKAQKLEEEGNKEIEELEEEVRRERIAGAHLEAKRILNRELGKKTDAIVSAAWQEFKSMREKDGQAYAKILSQILKKGKEEMGKGKLCCAKEEEGMIRKMAPSWKIENSDECKDGGIILESEDGKIRINGSLRNIFEEKLEKNIRWKAWKLLLKEAQSTGLQMRE